MAGKKPPRDGTASKGLPDNGRERTETVLEQGLPAHLRRRGTEGPTPPRAAPVSPRPRRGSRSP